MPSAVDADSIKQLISVECRLFGSPPPFLLCSGAFRIHNLCVVVVFFNANMFAVSWDNQIKTLQIKRSELDVGRGDQMERVLLRARRGTVG